MQKQTIPLQALLSASLFTFMSSTHAQGSVSDFEQSLINESEPIAENVLAGTAANFDMQALTNELKNRGWDVQHKTDGSLILIPKKPSDNKTDKNPSVNDQWQQLQQKLQNAGWSVVIDADGAMRLTPPNTASTAKSEKISHTNNSFKDMQQKLKASGWELTNNSDGSILLYPPELSPLKTAVSKTLPPCPGIKPTVAVSLPVNTWQEAHDIAQGWLNSEMLPHSMVGKIRKIFNVYIISIVSDKAPFVLIHQIAIKNNNGAVIVLN